MMDGLALDVRSSSWYADTFWQVPVAFVDFFSPKEKIDRVTTVTEMSSVFRLRALPTQIEEGACHPLRHGTELNWRGGIQDKI